MPRKRYFLSTVVFWVTLPRMVEEVAAAERSSVGQSDGLSVNIRWSGRELKKAITSSPSISSVQQSSNSIFIPEQIYPP